MVLELSVLLNKALKRDTLPSIIAYQRIDGPGSSLDLREFQQALWHLPKQIRNAEEDPAMLWTKELPRTIAITINTGTRITAYPFTEGSIAVESKDYKTKVVSISGEVLPIKENWLLKILDLFNLSGVMFVLENLRSNIKSSGLGGSAAVSTGVCILANELAGKPFSETQIIAMASRIEQDFGVSIVGTQEQSNVVFGGVTDYVWFPWGIPGCNGSGYGESLRSELISPKDYSELESRIAVFHTGQVRDSADVNSVWREALSTEKGYELHSRKPAIAYQFREALRLRKWEQALEALSAYRKIRTTLCSDYMKGAQEIIELALENGCEAFPLGAGGGGAVLVFSANPESLIALRADLKGYEEIIFNIKSRGHELINLPLR
jgi:galactokinase/mevalonate kinase-like predicted kinase